MDWMIAGALVALLVAAYHLWTVRRLRAKLAEVRAQASRAYADGVEHGAQRAHEVRDAEAESIRRQAYARGQRDALARRHVEAA